jgi:DNA-binding LytR/AlgR family response regulator
MKIKCLIVDDEPLAQDILVQYVGDCKSLELLKVCSDALEAGEFIRSQPVDLIFLDINMPRLSGISFVKTLNHPVLIIFTTAYPEHAAEGFEANAVDYLVKPFSFERFMKAVNKAIEWAEFRKEKENPGENDSIQNHGFILLRSDKKIFKINFDDILYFESIGDYIKVHLTDKKIIIHETVKNLVTQLPINKFIRVHKSYIVSVAKIRLIEGNQVDVEGKKIPIGLVFKEELLKRLNPGRIR